MVKDMILKQLEKEYKKLYKAGKIIIPEDTTQMAKDIMEGSGLPMSAVGIKEKDMKELLERIKSNNEQ